MKTNAITLPSNKKWHLTEKQVRDHIMHIMKLCLTLMLALFSIYGYTQSEFLAESNQNRAYYDSLVVILGSDSMQGTGYTQFQRRYRYWAPKLNPNFDYADYQMDLLSYCNNYRKTELENTPTWRFIGPNDVPVNGTAARGTGQIHYIYKDPHDNTGKTVFACSPVGGLFRSTNDGNTWENAGTDKGLPRSGVSSILIDSRSNSTWYVSTGNGEGFSGEKAWQTTIGVYRTNDNGENWKFIGLDRTIQGFPIFHMRKIIEIPNNTDSTHLVVTTTAGLYYSRNANSETPTWDSLKMGEFYDVVQDVNNPDILYASGSNNTGIYQFNLVTNAYSKIFDIDTITFPYDTMEVINPALRRISLKIPQVNSNFLFAVVSMRDYDYTAIYRYNTNTGIWHRFFTQANFNGYGRKLGWAIRPDTIGKLQILGRNVEQLFRFSNGLTNDSSALLKKINHDGDIQPHHDTHYLWVEDNNQTIWAGTDGGVYKGRFLNDTTIDWESKNYGLGVATIEYIDASETDKFVTSGQFDCGSNTYRSENGIEWTVEEQSHGDGYQNIIRNDNFYYLSAHEGMVHKYHQNNEDNIFMGSYTSCDTTIKNSVSYANFDTYYVNADDNLYAAGTKEVLKYYDTTWYEWSKLEEQIGCGISGTWRVAAKKKSNGVHQIYASARQEDSSYHYIYKSIDGGGPQVSKWVKVANTPNSGWISDIAITANTDSIVVSIRNQLFCANTTNPGNPVWYNITHDLQAGSISKIFIESGIPGRIWLATEHGVFYKNNGTTTWVDYTNNLPNCEVKAVKAVNKKVYVGTYGRGVWYASTPECGNVAGAHYTAPGESVNATSTNTYYGNVIVPTGNTYTIYGTLKMAADCKIIVEPGAKLIVDGGTITKACPDLWDGIEVWGNSNAVQDTINQGWVILKNQATIQYAKQGITAGKLGYAIVDLNFTGGVIQADDAQFKNNTTSIALLPYPHVEYRFALVHNKSYFKNCTFTYDSTYYFFNDRPTAHVQLTDVKGVLFEGNVFENTVSPSFAAGDKRGTGIAASQSGFKVVNLTGEKRNAFNNLNYGISAWDIFLSNKPVIIDQADFNKNRTGCYMGASTFVSVTNCVFNASLFYEALPGDIYSGLYLDNCTGYQVEENTFSSNYNPGWAYGYKSVGLVVNNSGPEDNFIYKNNFHNLLFATLAQNHNRSYNTQGTGLQYKCNVFENNYQDISVTWDGPPSELNGIALNQGSKASEITAPAGNFFSQKGTWSYSDFDNQGENIWYHLPSWQVVMQNYRKLRPQYYSDNTITLIYNDSIELWNVINGCSSNLVGKTKSELLSLIVNNELNRTIYADSLGSMVDQGNTTGLNLDVITSVPPETMILRDQLLSASPYLSDTVMVSAAEKEDVLPNSIITEVLAANPQSVRVENVLNTLDARLNPPSENEMASLHANDTIIGAKEILESKQAYYASNMQEAINGLSRLYMSDSLLIDINDSIKVALSVINSPDSYYKQAFCNYNSGDSTEVLNMLVQIPYSFELSTYQTEIHSGYESYFDLLLELSSQGKRPTEVDSTQKSQLYSIMQNTNEILQAYCRNMLIVTDGLTYNEPYIFPDTASTKSTQVKKPDFGDLFFTSSDFLRLYPNPASDYITIEYQLPYESKEGTIEIITLNGQKIEVIPLSNNWDQKTIDLRKYNSGSYVIRLWTGRKVLESEKFIKY